MNKFWSAALMALLLTGAAWGEDASAIRERTQARHPEIVALVKSGAVAEGADGYLEVKDAAKLADKADVVKAENQDRKAAYEAIAKATGTSAEAVGKRRAERIRSENAN